MNSIVGPTFRISIYADIQLFHLRLSPSKAKKSNTSAKSLLGVTIKNTQTEQNLVSRVMYSRDLYSQKISKI